MWCLTTIFNHGKSPLLSRVAAHTPQCSRNFIALSQNSDVLNHIQSFLLTRQLCINLDIVLVRSYRLNSIDRKMDIHECEENPCSENETQIKE